MKRKFVVAALLAVAVGIYLFANVVVTRIAAEVLSVALANVQGEAVAVSGLRANIWRLRAYADSVVYGDPSAPRARSTDVELDLDGPSLLRGEIRLDTVSSRQTDLYPARWPTTEPSSEPTDLDAVDRWLPEALKVSTLRFMHDESIVYQANDVVWRILTPAARHAEWSTSRENANLRYVAETSDWPRITARQGMDVQFFVERREQKETPSKLLAIDIVGKRTEQGFEVQWEFTMDGVQASLDYQVPTLFGMPAASRLTIAQLDVGKFMETASLVEQSAAPDVATTAAQSILQRPLPVLVLPSQQLQLTVSELNVSDEEVRNLSADVVIAAAHDDQPQKLSVSNLRAELPVSNLKGGLQAQWDAGWTASVDLAVETRSQQPEQSRLFDSSDWLWQSGTARFKTEGRTAAELLEHAAGQLDIVGAYRAGTELPARLHAVLDDRKGRIGADKLELAVGSSSVEGSLWFDESAENLVLALHAPTLDVAELLVTESGEAPQEPGYELPDYAWWTSRMHIDGRFTSDVLRLPSATIRALDARLQRTPAGAQLLASFAGENGGTFNLQANTIIKNDARQMSIKLQAKDLPAGAVVLDTPATVSGSLSLEGEGKSYPALVASLAGQVDASLNYSATEGQIRVKGQPRLLTSKTRLIGVALDHLELSTGHGPLASGTLSYDDSVPRITGELSSPHVDMDALLAALPARLRGSADEPTATAGTESAGAPAPVAPTKLDVASLVGELPPATLRLTTGSMTLFKQPLTAFSLDLQLDPGSLDVSELSFGSDYGDFQGSAQLSVDSGSVEFDAKGGIKQLDFGELLPEDRPLGFHDPLGGTFDVTTHGADWQALTANLRAQVKLDNGRSGDDALQIAMVAARAGAGVRLDLEQLKIGPSDLQGEVTFARGEPSQLSVNLQSTSFDLTHWAWLEEIDTRAARKESTKEVSSIADVSEDAFRVLGNMIAAPFHLFGGAGDTSSDRFFSDEKFRVGVLKSIDGVAKLSFGKVNASWGHAKNFSVDSTLKSGTLSLDLSSDEVNGGSASVKLSYDTSVSPPQASLVSNLRNFRPSDSATAAPRSAFISVTATGDSQAALAASSNGQLFLESGAGTADYAHFGLGIFSASLMNQVFGLLAPKRDESTPKLDCAVGYATVTDGVLVTPKAAVMQTPLANVLWRIKVDLGKETINAQFDSRSRTGAGISVGNVLSGTVRISGPLTSPHILPNTTGILWRGWAALATGGLSLLGESFIRRMLASDDACANLRGEIEKLVCGNDTPAAASPLVCPVSS